MFYRRLNDQLITSVDLSGAYEGCPLFILGGNQVLRTLPLDQLERSRLLTLAMNNVLYTYPNPTFWLTADKPVCYGGHFFSRPDIIKFAFMNYRDELVPATKRPLQEHPMMLFYTASEVGDLKADFFAEVPALTWCKSVFPLSLQIAWRLGCRRIYLVGCSFLTNRDTPYAWDVKLTPFQATWSQATYSTDMHRLRELKPSFAEHGFEIISCTPDSRANELFPYMSLEDAIVLELGKMPMPTSTRELKHSSDLRRPEA